MTTVTSGSLISQLDYNWVPCIWLFSITTQGSQKETLTGENAGAAAAQETGNRVTSVGLNTQKYGGLLLDFQAQF